MDQASSLGWKESLAQTYAEFINQLVAYAPRVAGAVALLIAGFIVAHLLRILSKKLVRGLDSLFQRAARIDGARQEELKGSYAVIISKIVFWTVMIFFVAATANMLGWQLLSGWMNSVIVYLPNLITGVLIILAGFLLGSGARTGVVGVARSAGVEQGQMLARVVQVVILSTAIVIGIEQIGIDAHFLSDALVVILGVLLAGGALAFGIGSKTLIANIIGAQYFRKHCSVGEQLRMGDVEGSVVEVTQTCIVVETPSGRTVIPAKYFQEQVSSFSSKVGGPAGDEPAEADKRATR